MTAGVEDNGSVEGANASPLLKPRQVRILKFAVVGMGVAILVGLAVVLLQIARLATRGKPAETAVAMPLPKPGAVPAEITLAMPLGARMRSWQLQTSRLAVEYEAPSTTGAAGSETQIAIIDLSTGAVVTRVHIGAATAK